MIETNLTQALWILRAKTMEMLRATAVDGDVVTQAGTEAIIAISDAASDRAPWLTGSLATAHSAEWKGSEGNAFVDPDAVNPVFGGKPAEYGVEVHGRKPWLQDTVEEDAPKIIGDFIRSIMLRWDEIWT